MDEDFRLIKKKKNYYRRREKIFIAGVEKGVGATHFAILLGNYFAEVLGLHTAIIDLNTDRDYSVLGELHDKNFTRNKSKSYKLRKITIFPNVLKNDMVNVPVNEYEIIIIDAGIKYKDYYAEANMCDKRYILGSACLWKLYNTKMEFYNVYNDTRLGGWNYLYFSGSEENVFFLKEDMNIKIINIPFIPNPLKVNTKQLAYIDKTVKGGI